MTRSILIAISPQVAACLVAAAPSVLAPEVVARALTAAVVNHAGEGVADVRAFAGEDPEQAVVEETVRRALRRWDDRVTHDEVAVDLPG